MLIVQNCIVSEDLADRCFCCDLQQCKGACCVEGDAGAPLLDAEVPELERLLPQVRPYMTDEGIAVVEQEGVAVRYPDGDLGTPLINNRDCAFISREGDLSLCAIERAWRAGEIDFMKPISCHLYPVRVEEYGQFTAVNYHQWDICRCAMVKGKQEGVPLYIYLKEPLVRRFGEEWYSDLVAECETFLARQKK